MATVGRRTLLVNGKRRKRRNRARRKMSAKQIRIFGTKAQKAALKRHRHSKKRRNAPRKAHRPRTRARSAPRRKQRRRKNVSEIITASLAGLAGNPGGRRKRKAKPHRKRKSMAKTRSNRKRAGRRVNRKHHSARRNRHYTRRRRHNTHRHRRNGYRRNPGVSSLTSVLVDAGWAGAGAIASRALPNLLLTSMNSGVVGYFANLATGFALSWGARSFLKNSRAAADIMLGTMIGVLFRAVQDFTPYGKFATLSGLGDFQMTEFFSPRIFTDSRSGAVDPSQSLIAAADANARVASASAAGRSGMGAFYRRSFLGR